MESGVGGGSVGRLWGMVEKEGRRERRRASRQRRKSRDRRRERGREKGGDEKTDGEVTEAEKEKGGAGTTSDGESLTASAHASNHGTVGIAASLAGDGMLSIGRGVLKGVRERAGRAGRLFGDGLG